LLVTSVAMIVWWIVLAATHTKYHMVNYWWQAGLAAITILYGIFGMMAAKHWSWLKSGVGQGVFFLSLGMIMWGIGQAGWTYYVIKDPNNQTPPSHVLDVLYSSSIPLWFYGMFKLSKATGARYGLRGVWAKIGVVALIIVIFAVSYYFLVNVARGGTSYFHSDTFWNIFFNLVYAAGDVVNLTLALAIFGLSWRFLGGRFKRPIILILIAFAIIYFADFFYSFYFGKNQYYNGHWSDLLYALWATVFGLGLCLLDPTTIRQAVVAPAQPAPLPPAPAPDTTPVPAVPQAVPAPAPDMPSLSSEPAEPGPAVPPANNTDYQGGGQ